MHESECLNNTERNICGCCYCLMSLLRVRMTGDWFLARLHRDYGIGIVVSTRHVDTASFLGDVIVTMSSGKAIQVGHRFNSRYIDKINDRSNSFSQTKLITDANRVIDKRLSDIGKVFSPTNEEEE